MRLETRENATTNPRFTQPLVARAYRGHGRAGGTIPAADATAVPDGADADESVRCASRVRHGELRSSIAGTRTAHRTCIRCLGMA